MTEPGLDPNFPRMVFRYGQAGDWLIVQNQNELDGLGPEWSKSPIPFEALPEPAPDPPPAPVFEPKRKRGRPRKV